jgi:hypothetical protein
MVKSVKHSSLFWNLHEQCNYLQITQIGNYLQTLLIRSEHCLARLELEDHDLKVN